MGRNVADGVDVDVFDEVVRRRQSGKRGDRDADDQSVAVVASAGTDTSKEGSVAMAPLARPTY